MSCKADANSKFLSNNNPWNSNFSFLCWVICNTLPTSGTFRSVWSVDDNGTFTSLAFFNSAGTQQLTLSGPGIAPDTVVLSGVTANTPYFVAGIYPNVGGATFTAYVGTGGSLTTVTSPSGSFSGTSGDLFVFNESANDQFLNGEALAVKIYSGVQLSLAAVQNEYRSWRPVRTASIYSFPKLLNNGTPEVDWSGKGNSFTATGTLVAAGNMPPIPYSPQPMMM